MVPGDQVTRDAFIVGPLCRVNTGRLGSCRHQRFLLLATSALFSYTIPYVALLSTTNYKHLSVKVTKRALHELYHRVPASLRADLRSDLAGEYGAVAIYERILATARWPDLREFTANHLETEAKHLALRRLSTLFIRSGRQSRVTPDHRKAPTRCLRQPCRSRKPPQRARLDTNRPQTATRALASQRQPCVSGCSALAYRHRWLSR